MIRTLFKPLFLLCTLFVLTLGSGTLMAETLRVSNMLVEGWQPMVPAAELLVDKNNQWDLSAAQQQPDWQAQQVTTINFGFSSSAYWLRWTIINDQLQPVDLVVDLGNPREDWVTWYLLRADAPVDEEGATTEFFATGDRFPHAQRPLATSRNFGFPIRLEAGEQVELYLHMDSFDGFFEPVPIKLYQADQYQLDEAQKSLVLTLYHGGLLFLTVYNLLLYFATRVRSFLMYVCYLFFFMMWNMTMNGYSFQYLWPDSPVLANHVLNICSAAAFAFFGLFTIEYLDLKKQAPAWLVRLIQVVSWLNFSAILFALPDWFALSIAYGQVTGMALIVVTLSTGIWLLVRGQRQARFYIVAFTMLGIGVMAYILKLVGVLPSNFFTNWGMQFGSAFETLILALGLADAMNTLKQEKLQAERDARVAQENLATQLEHKVKERTQELEEANRRLELLAITDELTGAFNRRHFKTLCAALLSQQNRQEPIAFCMLDIDYFKQYNDHYGHSGGDQVLFDITRALQTKLKRSGDTLFRLGGEEFGVLFTAKTAEAAFAFTVGLQQAIVNLAIPQNNSPDGIVTASFGVSFWSALSCPTVEMVYSSTDNALYAAKEQGRNTVRLAGEKSSLETVSSARPAQPFPSRDGTG